MKRSLPNAHKHARGQASPAPARERRPLTSPPVIAVAQATVGDVGTTFSADLVRALVREGLAVNALVTAEEPSADAQSALTQLLAAGAARVSVARVARDAPASVLDEALARVEADTLLVVVGNALPAVYQPLFCVVVSAARATHLPDSRRLRVLADLELSAPSAQMAGELAKLIARRYGPRPTGQ